jgi:hypothetical protein
MSSKELSSLKCLERFESPTKKTLHLTNPLIHVDQSSRSNHYLCCESHEAEFQEDFESDDEFLVFNDYFEGLVFSHQSEVVDWMKSKDEVGTQCNGGTPISLQALSREDIIETHYKVIIPRKNQEFLKHEPLVMLPRTAPHVSLPDTDDEGAFQCRYCFKIFLTGQALGGHMSRKHPSNQGKI